MPDNVFGLSPARDARNLCRQRNGVVQRTPHRRAAFAVPTPSIGASVCAAHLFFMRKFANGVFASASNVREQALQR